MNNDRNLQQKINARFSGVNRPDLAIADYKVLDKGDAVKLAFSFNPEIGVVTKAQLQEVFANHLPELQPIWSTCLRRECAVVLFATKKTVYKPIDAKLKMKTIVADLKFIDEDLGSVWDVVKAEDGTQRLKQVQKFNISELCSERSKRMGREANATVKVTAIVSEISVGDKVKWWNNNQGGEGQVAKLEEPMVHLNVDGEMVTLHRDSIYKVTEHDKKETKAKESYREDYWSAAISPKFGKDLVRGK